MDLRQLETFKAVYSTLSMTIAAKQIFLSPAAVSLQLKNLSEELGVELFVREGHHLIATPAAGRLMEHVNRLTGILEAMRRDFPAEAENDTRPFVLATGLTTLVYQLRTPIRELQSQFPRNEIRIKIGTTEEIVAGLQKRHFDLGIISLPVDNPDVQVIPLFEEELLVLVSPGACKGWKRTIEPEQLSGIPLILYPEDTNTGKIVRQFAQGLKLQLNVIMQFENTEAIKKLVEAGFGGSILPEKALEDKSVNVKLFRIKGRRLFRTIALAMPRGSYERKLTLRIAEILRQKLSLRSSGPSGESDDKSIINPDSPLERPAP